MHEQNISFEDILIVDHYPNTVFNDEERIKFASNIVSLLKTFEKSNKNLKAS